MKKSTVKIANYPEDIIINDTKLNDATYLTNSINYTNQPKVTVFDDETWFNGSIINFTLINCS